MIEQKLKTKKYRLAYIAKTSLAEKIKYWLSLK